MARDSSDFFFLAILGLWIGAMSGAMADVLPYQIWLMLTILLAIAAWRIQGDLVFHHIVMVFLIIGSFLGSIGNIIPYGVFIFLSIIEAILAWRDGSGTMQRSSLNSMIGIPFLLIISVGMFVNFTYADFCGVVSPGVSGDVCADPGNWVHGFPTIWSGCFQDCGLSPANFFANSIISVFITAAETGNHNYLGLIQAFFNSASQSSSVILTIITITIGAMLLLLGLGVGFTGQLLASGFGITVDDAGTRQAQSMGIGLILFGALFGNFGVWMLGSFGGKFGITFGISFLVFMFTMVFYGLYIQGKEFAS